VEAEGDDEELSVWEDNWDDDNLDNLDDFNEQLKQQISQK
jgi:26 proteasome complex subunit DSS1